MSKKYDYLIVGAGLYGATFAQYMYEKGKKCIVIDKRDHIGGNIYTQDISGIHTHVYGAHIFHTSNRQVWDYVNRWATFDNYVHSPIAIYKDKVFNLPFNMHTFYQMWGTVTPKAARQYIAAQTEQFDAPCKDNLESVAIALVGVDIYTALIKGYTHKQWGRECSKLPSSIIKRLPLRWTYDNNYFEDIYQGIPRLGYTSLVSNMLDKIPVRLNTDFFAIRDNAEYQAETVVYTGMIDRYFDYKLGKLQYRSLKFDTKILQSDNYQGISVINYTDVEIPYTRVIEHKHFYKHRSDKSVVSWEYPREYAEGNEPYYPIGDARNNELYARYIELSKACPNVIFGGRLAEYKYYDMDKTVESALNRAKSLV